MQPSVTKASGRKVVRLAVRIGGIWDRLPAEGASPCTFHGVILHLVPSTGQGGGMCIEHHLALLSPGALSGCSSPNAISLLQSDLLNFEGSIGIHTKKLQFLQFILESIFFPALLVV